MTGGHSHDQHGDVMDEGWWNDRYRSSPALWSGQPNPQLVAEAADLVPGTALDIGSGEGADAIWLAERGWQVTAVDISTVALERGAARAGMMGAEVVQRITWLQADVTAWSPEPASYDLVSAQFMQLPKDQRQLLHRRLAASVAPAGTLLVVGHHISDLETTVERLNQPERFFTSSDVAASLDPETWRIVVDEARPRTTLDPEGRTTTIHDAVLRAERTT